MSSRTRKLLAFGNAVVLAAIATLAWGKDSVSRTATAAGTTAKSATPPVVRALFVAGDTSMVAGVEKSTLIFGATVLSRDTAIGPHASASPPRMRVRIDSTLRKPAAMDNLTGDTATILAVDSAGVAPGGRAVFFTYGLLAGTRLVVQEVKRVVIQSDSALNIVRAQLAVADSQLTDRRIVDASNSADAVLLVQVDSIVKISVPDSEARHGSEHTPDWQIAVGTAVKAFRAQDTVLLHRALPTLFAAGGTQLTENAPQLVAGRSRILWLHRLSRLSPALRAGIDTTDRYFVLLADDARSATDSARVARALNPAGRGRGGGPAGPPPSGGVP